jgi:hypothetical protein
LRRQPLGARSPSASNEKKAPDTSNASSMQDASNRQFASGPHAQQQATKQQQAAQQQAAQQQAAQQQAAQQQAAQRAGAVAGAVASAASAAAPTAATVPTQASTAPAAAPPAAPAAPAAESAAVAGAARKALTLKSADKADKKSADTERDALTPAERANGMLAIVTDPATPTRRWRVFKFGNIEVSRDGGGTWANELLQPDVTFMAVASPAPGECWVVGTKGGVWHLALGTRLADNARRGAYAALDAVQGWQARQVPTAEDLVSVTASNGLSAVVTTRSGVQFATADGGQSWTRK